MENRTKNIKIWRFFAFIYDILFILLAAFIIHMLFGLIFKLDSAGFQIIMIYITLIIIILYLLFGELFFKNSFGKYLFGIEVVDNERFESLSLQSFLKRGLLKIIWPVEGFVLLFSKSSVRLGDLWAKSIVVNKVNNKLKPPARLITGIAVLIVLYFSFSISMGLAAKRTDFYQVGADYLTVNFDARITGIPNEVTQSRDTVDFCVPVSIDNNDRNVRIYLAKTEGAWSVFKTEFFKGHLGVSYGYSFSSKKK
jgi:uncharacterized RDD family membrane protein YckC